MAARTHPTLTHPQEIRVPKDSKKPKHLERSQNIKVSKDTTKSKNLKDTKESMKSEEVNNITYTKQPRAVQNGHITRLIRHGGVGIEWYGYRLVMRYRCWVLLVLVLDSVLTSVKKLLLSRSKLAILKILNPKFSQNGP